MSNVSTIFVFAHNEERLIERSLAALEAEAVELPLRAVVLANGCTDKTIERARSYRPEHMDLEIVEIEEGDKANAWNYAFRYQRSRGTAGAFFTDGDVRVVRGSLKAMLETASSRPECLAVASLPVSGRTQHRWSEHIRAVGGMPGCLYFVKGETLEMLDKAKFQMPKGLIGEDVLLQFILRSSLKPGQEQDAAKIALCKTAGFNAPSLSPLALRDIRLYYRRRVRNSLRYMQNALLMPQLRKRGLRALPREIDALYAHSKVRQLTPRKAFPDNIFDLIALRLIRSKTR